MNQTINDIKAEELVIGQLLLEPTCYEKVATILSNDVFYDYKTRTIFEAIKSLKNDYRPVDMVTVTRELGKKIEPYYLATLTMDICSTVNIIEHCLYLVDLAAKRTLLDTCASITSKINSGEDVYDAAEIAKTTAEKVISSASPVGSNIYSLEVRFSDDYKQPEPIISQGKTIILSRGNISVIKGKAKSRKTFLASILATSFFGNESFGLTSGFSHGRLLIIDTEQAPCDTHRIVRRIYNLNGWTCDMQNMLVLSLREYDVDERIKITEKAIRDYQPDFVIIDGAVDLCWDFNDTAESKKVIGLLMRLSTLFNCHITTVLHEGKGNGELRGHLGAEALNKSETVFEVVLDDTCSTVRPNATRKAPFSEFSFRVSETSHLPEYVGERPKPTKEDSLRAEARSIMSKTLSFKPLVYNDLVIAIQEYTGKSERTAKEKVKQAMSYELIFKNDEGKYQMKNDTDMPF